jgi:hypothetical protein
MFALRFGVHIFSKSDVCDFTYLIAKLYIYY